MPRFIATYDLNTAHGEFIAKAREEPWDCFIKSDEDEWYRLPNTTLIGEFLTHAAAVESLKRVRAATQAEVGRAVTMQKWIVCQYTRAKFNGDDHYPEG